ncbi:MAG TPA: hypothetical protein VFG64_10050 [Dongiaceae bacterium]|nr:hypothetical protein [Dongiaceae bacterium]
MTALALRQYDFGGFGVTRSVKSGFSDRDVRGHSGFAVSSAALDQLGGYWLGRVTEEIISLTRLELGWDSYNAVPVDSSVAIYALEVLASIVTDTTPAGSIHPLPGGGLQVEWHRGGEDLEMTFYRPYETEVTYVDVAGDEQVFGMQQDVSRLRRLLAKMPE